MIPAHATLLCGHVYCQNELITWIPWFRGGLALKAHRRLYHSNLGSRVMKKKKISWLRAAGAGPGCALFSSLTQILSL